MEAFKNTNLPIARVKKIMKSDEDVKVYFTRAASFPPLSTTIFLPYIGYLFWVLDDFARVPVFVCEGL